MVSRRRLLSTVAAGTTTALAGCTGGCGPTIPFVGTDMPQDGELAVSQVESVPSGATVVEFESLSAAERSLVTSAVEDGVARVCMRDDSDRAAALRALSDRMEGPETYLRRDGTEYGLWLRITDAVYAGTADSPEGDADPCC